MPPTTESNSSLTWLIFALLTVLTWGLYGVLLHTGRSGMPGGAEMGNASLKAFLWVGVAYFVVAIVGPVIVLKARGTNWSMTGSGITWSFIAGTAGAVGAFTLVLALGAASATMKGAAPSAVMPIVFGGAPVVNAIVAMLVHPPEGGFKSLSLPFILGILLAASGGFLVAKFAPSSRAGAPKPAAVAHGGPAAREKAE
jgi:hypothetical protein